MVPVIICELLEMLHCPTVLSLSLAPLCAAKRFEASPALVKPLLFALRAALEHSRACTSAGLGHSELSCLLKAQQGLVEDQFCRFVPSGRFRFCPDAREWQNST